MIDERQVREMLERRAETISATPTDKPNAIRRARRRLARNATVGGLVGLVVVAGALAGLRTIQATPTPVEPATPPPSPRVGSLAYAVDGDIYVAESDGSNAVRIANGRPPSECGGLGEYWAEGPIWSPDGRYLAYRHTNCEAPQGFPDVVISDPEGNLVAEFPSGRGWEIGWSPDSTRVAVWVELSETIGVFGLDGERQALLTVPPGMLSGGDHDPMWLPDGESLMFPWEDVVVPIDGSTPYHLQLPDLPRDGYVTYSPDGSRVAYTTHRSLVVAEADGSNPQVVFDDWVGEPVWSPAGDRIAFMSRSSSSVPNQLRLLDVATGTVTLLAESEDSLSVIDFSPEGDRILFSREEDGVSSLWSINADGSDLRRLVAGTYQGDWLSPSPTP
jgi:TolB protein